MDKTIPEPITREEQYLAAAAGYNVEPPEPITRKELFLAKLAGMDVEVPATYTRSELFVEAASERSAKAVIQPLEISENGTYTAPAGVDGYNPVVVNVASAGGSEDVRYVTFMSYDGSFEYGKKAVAVGDDCADPIARGIFDTPTRESDAQYNYTFYSWATTPNGGADSNALKAVEEDRTVYANFSSTVRYYNAKFYSDGKLIETVPTAYGSQAVPPDVPTKEGYTLSGWNPSDFTIYSDVDFNAVWTELTGYYYITTLSGFPNTSIVDLAINNAGTDVAVGMYGNGCPYVYDISGDSPVQKPLSDTTGRSMQYVDYNFDNTKLYGLYTYRDSSTYKYQSYVTPFLISNGNYSKETGSWLGSADLSSCTVMRCSPVDNTRVTGRSGNNKNTIGISDSSGTKTVTLDGDSASFGDFSTDGKLFAFRMRTSLAGSSAGEKYSVHILDVENATVVKTIGESSAKVLDTSFNQDGTLIAVIKNAAPFVEIYSVSSGELVLSFGSILTSAAAGCFVNGTNELIVADGKNVRVFDCSAAEPQEITTIPTYQCSGIPSFMRSNRSGTRVGIMSTDSDTIEIWGRA